MKGPFGWFGGLLLTLVVSVWLKWALYLALKCGIFT